MDYQQMISTMTPEIYESLKRAVELGKWPNGEKLTAEQRQSCLQAVIAYDHKHKPEEERVGYIHTKKHDHCGSEAEVTGVDDISPLKWK
jgi:hypothetical protein